MTNEWISSLKPLHEQATVSRFALLVGKSKPVISERLKQHVINEGDSYLQWLHDYIEHLSAVAGGRGGDNQEELTQAKIEDLKTKSGLNRLAYHEKLGSLVPVEAAETSLIEWGSYTNRQIIEAFNEFVFEIQDKYSITIEPEIREKIVRSTTGRIRDYAQKLGESFTADQ